MAMAQHQDLYDDIHKLAESLDEAEIKGHISRLGEEIAARQADRGKIRWVLRVHERWPWMLNVEP